MKKGLLTVLLLSIVSSCGYTMVGFNNEIPVKYYINTVQNDTIDTSIGELIQTEAERFFIKYNELASYKNATYFMDIIIEDLNYIDPILSATEQANSTKISYNLTIVVSNIQWKEIYTWNKTTSESFSIATDVSKTLQRRDEQLKKNIDDTLTSFRLKVNRIVYK